MNLLLAPFRSGLSSRAKFGFVFAGYAAAFVAATVATAIRIAATQGPDAQASSGMYAFGDSILWLAVFSMVATVPTAIALVHLRAMPRFWWISAGLALAVAATGVAGSLLYMVWTGRSPAPGLLGTLAMLSPLRFLLAPILTGVFVLFALLAPVRGAQRLFVLAAVVEGLAGAAAFLRLLSRAF